MPNVQMPDGAIVNMPDQIDPAMGARLRAYQTDHAIGAANAAANAQEHGPVQDVVDMVKSGVTHLPAAFKGLLDSLKGDPLHNPDIGANLHSAVHAVTNPTETLSSIGSTLENATPQQVGANVLAPLVAGGAAGKVAGLAGATGEAVNAPAAVAKYGLRTGADNPIARSIAGDSARPTVTAHNQEIANPAIGAQAGVPHGTPLSARVTDAAGKERSVLEAAADAPNSVYERTKATLPTAPLSPAAAQTVASIGGEDLVTHSPDVQAQVAAQKERLLDGPLSGPQVVDTQKALRFNGFGNTAAEDPERVALGRAQLKMADALHQHMVDSIPPGADVSADQLVEARRALAQNYTVRHLLKGNDVDLQALARFNRNNPGILSGPMKDFAEFADLHPEVSSLPSKGERFNPPGLAHDVASVDLKSPSSYLQPFFGAAARRRLVGGGTPPQVPVTGLGGEFAPLPPGELQMQPPPGAAFEAHQPGMHLADELAPLQQPLELQPPPGAPAYNPHQPDLATHEPSNLTLGDLLAPKRKKR